MIKKGKRYNRYTIPDDFKRGIKQGNKRRS